jgi:hypothetical protein
MAQQFNEFRKLEKQLAEVQHNVDEVQMHVCCLCV